MNTEQPQEQPEPRSDGKREEPRRVPPPSHRFYAVDGFGVPDTRFPLEHPLMIAIPLSERWWVK